MPPKQKVTQKKAQVKKATKSEAPTPLKVLPTRPHMALGSRQPTGLGQRPHISLGSLRK